MTAATEQATSFTVEQSQLLAVYHAPDKHKTIKSAVIIITGGPQYRVGSHRIFVQLSRFLSQHNIAVFRFDQRGHGDSSGHIREYDNYQKDLQGAIEHLLTLNNDIEQITLWGLCDGATFAGMEADIHPKISSLILCNPWLESENATALTQIRHYYPNRIRKSNIVHLLQHPKQLIHTAINLLSQLISASKKPSHDTPIKSFFTAISNFQGDILFLYGSDDLTAKRFKLIAQEYPEIMTGPRVSQINIADSDHTFTHHSAKKLMFDACLTWLNNISSDQESK